ncbi:alpha/beta hydrolase [Ruania albidiflava]|uniref:alpha/beta hydrolase n=1 Tax=Ruania albidiflava TaxID=366586 RepID=UPI0003B45081|nr:alpha/beta hydrolase [Ruania albidiflava]
MAEGEEVPAGEAQPTGAEVDDSGLPRRWPRRLLKVGIGLLTSILALALVVVIAFQVSYWPTTLLLRNLPAFNGDDPAAGQVAAPAGVSSSFDVVYRPGDEDGRMDVFWPEGEEGPLPTVVWVHGGAFVAGTKDGTTTYLQTIAARGYTTISVEYTKAPEEQYPYQLGQVADALAYVDAHAEELHVDPSRIVLGGDSAGGHIAAQTAMAISQPGYAEAAGLQRPLDAEQLVGTVLMCGAYDLHLPDYDDGITGRFQRDIIWAYTGQKEFLDDPALAYASLPQHVTGELPPTFISAGNGDPLEAHSHSMAQALAAAGADVDALFFPADTDPPVPHEYQVALHTEPAQLALTRVLDFLQAQVQ